MYFEQLKLEMAVEITIGVYDPNGIHAMSDVTEVVVKCKGSA